MPFLRFPDDSPEMAYLRERRAALGGPLPARRSRSTESLAVPELSAFGGQLAGTPGREISTTMAFVRILNTLLRDKKIGKRVVPIVPDESRTFGMEGMFRQFGIFSQVGQLYQPEDASQLMFYREAPDGQMLQEGINEAGAMSSWIAAATAYSTSNVPMIPFYIFYSMFGFQRVMDLAWAAGDSRARGFLLGGTAGRTTLNGEGLQHEDGHSHVLSAVIPNCVSYDPTYSYEVAVIIQDGLRRMFTEQEDVYFYITVMNENYEHPALPEGAEAGILKGMYLLREGRRNGRRREGRRRRGCSCSAAAPSCGRCSPPLTCWPPTTALARTCGACRASPSCGARASRPSGGTCCTRRSRPGAVTSRPASPIGLVRWSPPPTTSSPSPIRSAPSCRSATGYWAPMASAGRTTAGTCAASSRSTGTTSPLSALALLAEDGTVPAAEVADAISRYGIDADKPDPSRV